MIGVPQNPLEDGGIAGYAARLRRHETTVAATARAYLDRIAALDPTIAVYEHVAGEEALKTAQALDALLAAGTDLGPLMGVPVAIKDIIEVEGMPTRCGSRIDVTDLVGPEGSFVKALRGAGCVILGKLATVEFATGNTGVNHRGRTPQNPWDAKEFRVTSGSSSGSAAAVAAGLCGFAIGTDTGGSVRGPAAFCGVVGMRVSPGPWATDGVFPMSSTFDTIGPLARSAEDAAIVWAALTGNPAPQPAALDGVRLGRPRDAFFDGLDEHVALCLERALSALSKAGVRLVEFDLPEAIDADALYGTISRAETIAAFGRERFEAVRGEMNPDVEARMAPGLKVTAEDYIRALGRHKALIERGKFLMRDLDGWVGPTKQRVAPVFPGPFKTIEAERELVAACGGPTRAATVFGLCASSQPIQVFGSPLPVGLQLMCPGGTEARLLSLALACERLFGMPLRPDLSNFAHGL